MNCFLVLYQKYKFKSGHTTAPPTPLCIAEFFAGFVHEEDTGTVPSDEDTQASLGTFVTQVWCLCKDTQPVRLWKFLYPLRVQITAFEKKKTSEEFPKSNW